MNFVSALSSYIYFFLQLTFADFAPYLITTEASLPALNKELPTPITMERFRPNIVISGTEKPWVEVCSLLSDFAANVP